MNKKNTIEIIALKQCFVEKREKNVFQLLETYFIKRQSYLKNIPKDLLQSMNSLFESLIAN